MPNQMLTRNAFRQFLIRKTGSSIANLIAPSLSGVQFPGGAYSAYGGSWSDAGTATMILQSSPDNSAWSDVGATGSSGTFATGASLANKYVRIKATHPSGPVAYSSSLLLGPNYDQVLDTAGNDNYLSKTVSTPFLGLDLSTGGKLWFAAMFYYPGSGLEETAAIVSLGDTASPGVDMTLLPNVTQMRDGGVGAWCDMQAQGRIAASKWYIAGAMFRMPSGATIGSTHWIDGVKGTEAVSSSTITMSHFNTLRFLKTANNSADNAENFDLPVAWIAWGTGDPSNAITWAQNGGALRNIWDYPNFAADGATCADKVIFARVSPGNTTFSASEANSAGGTITGMTLSGTLAWAARLPGFINPNGDPPTTPIVNTYPGAFANAGETIKMVAQSINVGATTPGLFTVASIVHSIDGAKTVTSGTFPAGTAGGTLTLTNLAYNGGATRTFTVEVVPTTGVVANPQFRSLYNGNARAAMIQPYTSPGAGTTYANAAALKTAIDGLAAAGTLKVANADFTGQTLTLTAKDYGGATVTCTNAQGCKLAAIVMDGALNLTLQGFESVQGISGTGVAGITIDQCRGRTLTFTGASGATSNVTITNWCGYDDGTNQQLTFTTLNRLTLRRVAHANIVGTSGDNLHLTGINTILMDRFCLCSNHANVAGMHPDNVQTYQSGSQGYTNGLIQNGVLMNTLGAGEVGSEGIFLTGINAQDLRVRNCVVKSSLANSVIIGGGRQSVGIENISANGTVSIQSDSLSASGYADNNVFGGYSNVMASAAIGPETNTQKLTTMTTGYPQYGTYPDDWHAWANPAAGYTTAGAYALIAELVASEAAYP